MEIVETLSSNGIDSSKIKVGTVVRFKSASEMSRLESSGNMRCGWNDRMEFLCGQTRTITEEILNNINKGDDVVFEEEGRDDGHYDVWMVSLDMLELVVEEPESTEEKKPKGREKLDLPHTDDPKIIEEMINKVDRKRLQKLLVISANSSNFSMKDLTGEMLDKYLNLWATAKVDFYLLFGNSLTIEKDIELEATDADLEERSINLCHKFPKYSPTLSLFSVPNWKSNTCGEKKVLETYWPNYKRDMKLSKFLSQFIGDKELDDYIAGMISDRMIKSKLTISIDPYDYLTMSLNKYGWSSCQQIGKGEYSKGPTSIMLDDATLIAFKSTGKNMDYDYKNFEFKGNSKSWRQCIYYDKGSSAMIFSRQYPSYIDILTQYTRSFLEEKVASYFGVEDSWSLVRNSREGYKTGSNCVYHDVLNGHNHELIRHREFKKVPAKIIVGKDVPCLKCGHITKDPGHHILCSGCS